MAFALRAEQLSMGNFEGIDAAKTRVPVVATALYYVPTRSHGHGAAINSFVGLWRGLARSGNTMTKSGMIISKVAATVTAHLLLGELGSNRDRMYLHVSATLC